MTATKPEKTAFQGSDLRQSLTYRLTRLNAQMTAQAARILRKSAGISITQWRLLVLIEEDEALPPAEIVRLTGLDKGQVSRTIKAMVNDGLILSRISETDHRSHRLFLTAQGRTKLEAASPAMRHRRETLADSLSDLERAAFLDALDKIEAAAAGLEEGA